MPRPQRLAPFDIVVALRLTEPAGTIAALADDLASVPSQVHAAIGRLTAAGLLKPGTRAANPRALAEFLAHGVRYAFPVTKGPLVSGVPTAYSAPPLASEVDAVDVVVWPAPLHPAAVHGFGLVPLYAKAPLLMDRAPGLYQLLALTDALRLGDPRTRVSARETLERLLGVRG